MGELIADIVARGSGNDWFVPLFFGGTIGLSFVGYYWRFFAQWIHGILGRDWPTVSAVIDVVSVVEQTGRGRYDEYTIGYLATLTYFYRNPELQMGEFGQSFGSEAEAQAWCDAYKGCNVMVHIDPRDPSRSVLRKEDLDRVWR